MLEAESKTVLNFCGMDIALQERYIQKCQEVQKIKGNNFEVSKEIKTYEYENNEMDF